MNELVSSLWLSYLHNHSSHLYSEPISFFQEITCGWLWPSRSWDWRWFWERRSKELAFAAGNLNPRPSVLYWGQLSSLVFTWWEESSTLSLPCSWSEVWVDTQWLCGWGGEVAQLVECCLSHTKPWVWSPTPQKLTSGFVPVILALQK